MSSTLLVRWRFTAYSEEEAGRLGVETGNVPVVGASDLAGNYSPAKFGEHDRVVAYVQAVDLAPPGPAVYVPVKEGPPEKPSGELYGI